MPSLDSTHRWVVIDDMHPDVQYTGPWVPNDGANFDSTGNFGRSYLNTLHAASATATLSYSFFGERVHSFPLPPLD